MDIKNKMEKSKSSTRFKEIIFHILTIFTLKLIRGSSAWSPVKGVPLFVAGFLNSSFFSDPQ